MTLKFEDTTVPAFRQLGVVYEGYDFFALPAGEMEQLQRDAERYRRLKRLHGSDRSMGHWCALYYDCQFTLDSRTLAEIADEAEGAK